MSSIAVIINPISGGGRGKKIWNILLPGLRALFERIDYRMCNKVDDMVQLTRILLQNNPDYFLIIGGDGSLSQAVNGLYSQDQLLSPKTTYAYFNSGCGGDFASQFPPQKVTEFLDRLVHKKTVETNIGKITFSNKRIRYFINIASCGLSAHVVEQSSHSKWLKKLGGPINYFVNALLGLLTYKLTPVKIQLDDNEPFESNIFLIAICNGQYFGGGMHVSPTAKFNDDLLDVVIFQNFTRLSAMIKLRKVYSGRHLLEKKVHYVQAKKIKVTAMNNFNLAVEADGELIGRLTASFALLPEKLKLVV
ncbi:diacylglycerol/lipid kinase family protein [Legionella jordanis]|uniref:Transcriptional regulator n=1 Tax=Legionella jordanis TaxID=456 RepID=A0A0W0V904_9GAMM|nr:YegS/Rv2252/BmrU family lipid kinase [Legionella jordanis]KTD16588.1 transcriptional regulator [Legionella jordanis]RMX03873.1 YegS/Rv2252/BmrU family lipid kinase [Legionella jordanis]VEH11948.1 transcriptional regulator [Legionella jordanis]HAT8712748.1 YegS/Rv2252/BmrU family lipid kinase [Legionella jordanis]